MKHFDSLLTRTDCQRDNVGVRVPMVGGYSAFCKYTAKSGDWITWTSPTDNVRRTGRVICRVTCEKEVWIEVAELHLADVQAVFVRWIDPLWVQFNRDKSPKELLAWIAADTWTPEQVHADIHTGTTYA